MEVEYPHWQREYHAALVEFEPTKLAVLVEAAEAAMFNRLQALAGTADGNSERQAIVDASQALLSIKEDLLEFPPVDPKKSPSKSELD